MSTVPDRPGNNGDPVEALLRQMPQYTAGSIEWRLENGTLQLRGCVKSFYQKQLAQTAARRLPGVQRIVNELEVEQRAARCAMPGDE